MSEDRLQYEIIKWFNNKIPAERGYLCRTENKTNKGANAKALGMVKGMSDLKYTAPCGTQILIELKTLNSRHDVNHLRKQLDFIVKHSIRGAVGFFVFELEAFQTIIANIVPNGVNLRALTMATHSQQYIKDMIEWADTKGSKTIELCYDFKTCKV